MGIELQHVINKKSGINDLKLTFHGVTTEITDSTDAIREYLLGLDKLLKRLMPLFLIVTVSFDTST